MGPSDDERRRLEKTYRDLDAQELLRLFETRETLSGAAVDALRMELRLRGLDPDSLRATVPKAIPTDDEESAGDATLAEAESAPSEEPSRAGPPPAAQGDAEPDGEAAAAEDPLPAEAAASAATLRCARCGARNPAIEDLCLRCGQPLADGPQHQTMSRRVAESPPAPRPNGTVASATTGVIGISALVFASYSLTLEVRLLAVTVVAGTFGIAALAAALFLYRVEKRRKAAEAAANQL